jgi:hypothetical protein
MELSSPTPALDASDICLLVGVFAGYRDVRNELLENIRLLIGRAKPPPLSRTIRAAI